ncbi:hypothetical protein OQZ33_19490 [Pedobacter sp. MC2016-05]|uniref:hypothetical protein n=1 Tax=Pedobacter sp. MC2016-05 TaxID=2994474 RepID=UPI002246A284|nr:hypothetical protein [Pedobacter sp. MC2016-05]MCX2476526.1 hypothetical protein [Pedobacter sp. MC2016-05]
MENDNENNVDLKNERSDQEQLSQKALGNIDVNDQLDQSDNDILSTPKTSGTGSNNAAAAPDSLIVHEDKKGDERYEQGNEKEE